MVLYGAAQFGYAVDDHNWSRCLRSPISRWRADNSWEHTDECSTQARAPALAESQSLSVTWIDLGRPKAACREHLLPRQNRSTAAPKPLVCQEQPVLDVTQAVGPRYAVESIANSGNQSLTFANHLCKTPGVWAVSVLDWDRRSTPVYRVRRCGSRPIEPNRWPVPGFVRWFWCALKSACCRSFASTGTKQGRTAPNTSAQWMEFTSTRTAHGMNCRNDGRAMCRGEAPRG
jgi:hypothetical protein